MPMPIQAKWLRVLQDGCFQRLGGRDLIKTDVRIIAATNKNLESRRDEGAFRDDLYWRLNVVSIFIPPLRERKEDIDDLVKYFIQKFNRELGKNVKGVAPGLLTEFQNYRWPGNIRELQGIVQSGMVVCQKDVLTAEDCGWPPKQKPFPGDRDIEQLLSEAAGMILETGGVNIYKDGVDSFERLLVKRALELTNQNQVSAARLLGISRNTLRSKIEGE
jgi:two-component system response regulator AtoC